MASLEQYVKIMRDAQVDVARRLGMDLSYADKQSRVAALSALTVQAVLVKALVDKGVLTNAELQAAINTIRSPAYAPTPIPVEPEPWDITPATGV
jgi:hypothetical protein